MVSHNFKLQKTRDYFIRTSCKRVIFITCFFIFMYVFIVIKQKSSKLKTNHVYEEINNASKVTITPKVYYKTSTSSPDLKYILLWKGNEYAPLYYFSRGQKSFLEQNCTMTNCYVTTNRMFFGNFRRFDAVAFNGRRIASFTHRGNQPRQRYAHQKFIYFDMESSDNYPVCKNIFEGFFNWTSTYRLDSDIPYPYILIKNNLGETVGPKLDMKWIEDMDEVSEELINKLLSKTRALAWFVSHCKTRSGREQKMKDIQEALSTYNLTVDIYGECGTKKCPRNKKTECENKLETDYYFYYSAENSFAEDYVTEKLLTAVQHNVVPIVYGGANYSRFLPPGSYLDSRNLNVTELAAKIYYSMNNPDEYIQYFRWKSHYSYHQPATNQNVCSVCEALNSKAFIKPTVYNNFRQWWNPNFKKRCKL